MHKLNYILIRVKKKKEKIYKLNFILKYFYHKVISNLFDYIIKHNLSIFGNLKWILNSEKVQNKNLKTWYLIAKLLYSL